MPWMRVNVVEHDGTKYECTINTDTIVRFMSLFGGTLIRFVDGSLIQTSDPIEEITESVLRADEKKAKHGLPNNL